jgi:hypothetical protein
MRRAGADGWSKRRSLDRGPHLWPPTRLGSARALVPVSPSRLVYARPTSVVTVAPIEVQPRKLTSYVSPAMNFCTTRVR